MALKCFNFPPKFLKSLFTHSAIEVFDYNQATIIFLEEMIYVHIREVLRKFVAAQSPPMTILAEGYR